MTELNQSEENFKHNTDELLDDWIINIISVLRRERFFLSTYAQENKYLNLLKTVPFAFQNFVSDDAFDIDRGSSVGFVVGNGGTRSRSFVIPEIFETGVHLKVQIDYKDGDYVDVQFSTICYA